MLLAKEGDTVEPGNKIAIISRCAEAATHIAPSEGTSKKAAPQPTQNVTEEKKAPEVETVPITEKPKAPVPPWHSPAEPQLPPKERERQVPVTRLWKRIATWLKNSQNTFATLSTSIEVDMTDLKKLHAEYEDAFVEKHGVRLGLMSGFVKAAINALQHQPVVNAVIDGNDVIYRDHIDVSIAGLVVRVIRDAENMNFADIEKAVNTLVKKANNGTLSIDEIAGGTLTVSNGGVYGSLLSTPIINPPQEMETKT